MLNNKVANTLYLISVADRKSTAVMYPADDVEVG